MQFQDWNFTQHHQNLPRGRAKAAFDRSLNRTRQVYNVRNVVNERTRAALRKLRRGRVLDSSRPGITVEQLAEHDGRFVIGGESDFSPYEPTSLASSPWARSSESTLRGNGFYSSSEWESIDLYSAGSSIPGAVAETPVSSLSLESAGALAGVSDIAPLVAGKLYLYSKDPAYGTQGNYAQGWSVIARREAQRQYEAPKQAGYPRDWANNNHGNTQ